MGWYAVGIDVGVNNLAIAMVVLDAPGVAPRVAYSERVDLKAIPCDSRICRLMHTKMARDRVDHFVQAFKPILEESRVVAVEKQPWTGVTDVEQLLMAHPTLRSKAILVQPRSMHAHFKFGKADYDTRKELSQQTAALYGWKAVDEGSCTRLHDMSDAACIGIYALQRFHGAGVAAPGVDLPPILSPYWNKAPPPPPPPEPPVVPTLAGPTDGTGDRQIDFSRFEFKGTAYLRPTVHTVL